MINRNNLFLREIPSLILIEALDNPDSILTSFHKKYDMTYSHVCKMMVILKELGLVETRKIGRTRKVRLTEDGVDIAKDLKLLYERTKKFKR